MVTDDEHGPSLWRALRSVEYWALVAVGLAGLAHASPLLSVVGGAFALSLVSWPRARWRDPMQKARNADCKWRQRAVLAWYGGLRWHGVRYWLRGHFTALVIVAHMANNLLHCGLAYVAGMASGWLWGVP